MKRSMNRMSIWRILLCAFLIVALMSAGVLAEIEFDVDPNDTAGGLSYEEGISIDLEDGDGALSLDKLESDEFDLSGQMPDDTATAGGEGEAEIDPNADANNAVEVEIEEGVYYLLAVNGNASGSYLSYVSRTDEYKNLQFEKENEINADKWIIRKDPSRDGCYNISWHFYPDHYIQTDKPHGKTNVYCSVDQKYENAFKFYRESGDDNYNNISIRLACDPNYRINRHKKIRAFKPDLIYLNANSDNDTTNKLWKLVPYRTSVYYFDRNDYTWAQIYQTQSIHVGGNWNIITDIPPFLKDEDFHGWHEAYIPDLYYEPGQKMTNGQHKALYPAYGNNTWRLASVKAASPDLSAKKNGKLRIDWSKFRDKMRKKAEWKKAKFIIVEYSTDPNFRENVKSKTIKRGTINKEKAKTTLSKLKLKKTYYLRVRLWDGIATYSRWSKVIKIKTKR